MSSNSVRRLLKKTAPVSFVVALAASGIGLMQATDANAAGACSQQGVLTVPSGVLYGGGNQYPKTYCTNVSGALRAAPTKSASEVNVLRTTHSWFACFMNTRTEGTWFLTEGDDNGKWGWIRSTAVHEAKSDGTTPGIVGCVTGKLKAPVVSTQGSDAGARAVAAARTRDGDPYVWGAKGPDSFDCSGLVLWSYRQAGVELPTGGPRISRAMAAKLDDQGKKIDAPSKAGDLIFYGDPIVHVAMYTGNPDEMIEAGGTGHGVHVTKLRTDWNTVMRPVP